MVRLSCLTESEFEHWLDEGCLARDASEAAGAPGQQQAQKRIVNLSLLPRPRAAVRELFLFVPTMNSGRSSLADLGRTAKAKEASEAVGLASSKTSAIVAGTTWRTTARIGIKVGA